MNEYLHDEKLFCKTCVSLLVWHPVDRICADNMSPASRQFQEGDLLAVRETRSDPEFRVGRVTGVDDAEVHVHHYGGRTIQGTLQPVWIEKNTSKSILGALKWWEHGSPWTGSYPLESGYILAKLQATCKPAPASARARKKKPVKTSTGVKLCSSSIARLDGYTFLDIYKHDTN